MEDPVDAICYGHWKKLAEELHLGLAQTLKRLRTLCDGILSADLQKLSLPEECGSVLSIVKTRASRIIKTTEK